MSHLTPLTARSTIGELALTDFQISPSVPGRVVAQQLEQRPHLSGVLVVESGQVLGVISRRRFHACLSQPYGLELFLKRPIQIFLESYNQHRPPLILPHTETIDVAVRRGLGRENDEDVFEPIVVLFEGPPHTNTQAYYLLDFQTLLLAQSQILTEVNTQIEHQRSHLEHEQKKVREYAHLLEQQKAVIQERNQVLEQQQSQLISQSQQIEQLNSRFMKIGRVLSHEGKKAFQATFSGVNAICLNTNQVVNIGRLLGEELATIHRTSHLIEEVSQQVRHLSVQAAIVANRAGAEMSGFSHIAADIAKLVNRTFEAGQQMNRVVDRFKERIGKLTESAQMGTAVARSLLAEIEQAAIALNELESLVQHQELDGAIAPLPLPPLPDPARLGSSDDDPVSEETLALIEKLTAAEETLSDLRQMIHTHRAEPLVQKIRDTLEQHRRPTP